jgi:hypothetical protein
VASIWLLRGNAEAVMVRNCDRAATGHFCSVGGDFLPGKRVLYGYVLSTLPASGLKSR